VKTKNKKKKNFARSKNALYLEKKITTSMDTAIQINRGLKIMGHFMTQR